MRLSATLITCSLALGPIVTTTAAHAQDEPPVAQCGMDPYRLLPEAQMGLLLDYEEIPLWNMHPGLIDELLTGTDFNAVTPVPWGTRMFRYRYTTQDRGVAVEATSLLALPTHPNFKSKVGGRGPAPEFSWVLYLHGTTGFSDPCAPSGMLEGPSLAALVASQGFVTVAPDYIGMNGFGEASTTEHGYVVGEQTAIGSWDALRAGQELFDEVVRRPFFGLDEQVIIWGASQGGHAALFTELYGPYYAPEFNVTAVAASVPPTALKPLVSYGFQALNDVTGLMSVEIAANHFWYGSPDSLDGIFTNEDPYYLADNAYDIIYPTEECNPGEGLDGDEITDLFTQEFVDLVQAEDWDALQPFTCFWEANSLATSPVPRLRVTPTLMQYSENDELVVMETQRPDFLRLCAQGYQLEYLECKDARHTDGAIWSLPEQIDWMKARLANAPINPNGVCVVNEPVCCAGSPSDVCVPE